jgi:hypothetical protein
MDIPKSLESTWKQVSNDGKITKEDYDKLVAAAAPTGKEEELDQAETDFLTNLRSQLEQNSGAKGSVPGDGVSFKEPGDTAPASVITAKDFGEVPESLKAAWGKAIEDGNISADDYKFLLGVAAPNWDDAELDPKEQDFLANLKGLLEKTGKTIELASAGTAKTEVAPPVQTKSTKAPVAGDPDTEQLTQVKSILDSLNDDPDFAPLRNIVETRLQNNQAGKQYSENVNDIMQGIDPAKLGTLTDAKAKLAGEFAKLPENLKNNPQIKQLHDDTASYVDIAIKQLGVKGTAKNNNAGQAPKSHKAKTPQTGTAAKSHSTAKPKTNGNNSDVPSTLKKAWDNAIKDGNLTRDDFEQLMKAAAPNKKNSEFDNKELNFLDKVRKNLDAHDGIISFVDTPEDAPSGNTDDGIPASLKSTWSKVTQDGDLTGEDYAELLKAAAPTGKNSEFDDKELEFLAPLKDQLAQNNGVITINRKNVKPGTTADSGIGAVPDTLKETWDRVTKDGNLTRDGFEEVIKAAAPNDKMEELDEAENKFLSVVKAKFDSSGTDSIPVNGSQPPSADAGTVPPDLKATWDKIQAKGVLTNSDFNKLVSAAAPNGNDSDLDEQEIAFLGNLRQQLTESGGSLDLKTQAASGRENKPVLLNWPGYNRETKSALKNAYGGNVIGSDMPLLPTKVAKQIAAAFGVSSIMDLQRLVNAKVDGKFGPETFFKAKVLAATMMNQANGQLEQVNQMLNALGNDPEVLKMKEQLSSGKTTAAPKESTADEPQITVNQDLMPKTLVAAWNQVTKDGKLTIDGFQEVLKAAAPSGKNSEFDDEELGFIAPVKDLLAQNNGVLTVKTISEPGNNSEPAKNSAAGVPASMVNTWNQVTKDGKLTIDGFQELLKAAAPSGKNSEFDNEELEFIAPLKEQLAKNNGVISVGGKSETAEKKTESVKPAANIDLGGINPNDQVAVANLQKKINILNGIYEKSMQKSFAKVPTDGKITDEFVKALAEFQKTVGKPAVKAVMENEAGLKQELNMPSLDNRSAKFLVFQDNDFKILGNVKDLTRVETARTLLAKAGITPGPYKMEYPEDTAKNGDLKLTGNGINLVIFDNIQNGRNSGAAGDIQVKGTVNGKTVDISYWENQRRGDETVKKNGLFTLKINVDGTENIQKSDKGFLPGPLVVIKPKK